MKSSKLFMAIGAVAALCFNAHAAISVGPSGAGPLTFDTGPTVADGWSTMQVGTAAGTFTTAAALDAAVIASLSAASVNMPLGTSATVPPSQNALARHNTTGLYLQTRPTGIDYLVLMATLQNDTVGNISQITVSYDWDQKNNNPVNEDVPGHRTFWSLTGAPGSWTLIPQFSTFTTTSTAQNLLASINVGTWGPGTPLYIAWVDDNGPGSTADPMEGSYTIDNFTVSLGAGFVTITSPGNGQRFAVGVPITVNADASLPGTITGINFFQGTTSLGTDTTAPYSAVYNGATLGTHDLTAVASDNMGNTRTSTVVQVVVVANTAPTVTINIPVANDMIVASNVVLFATAADTDGTTVSQVQFYDGNTPVGAADTTAPYSINYKPVSAGIHTFRAVATDSLGMPGTSAPVVITVVQPLNSLVPFGAVWKYLDDGSDQNTAGQWYQNGFNDTAWASGPAEIGYGDGDEATIVGFGGNPNAKFITTYFRHHFTVPALPVITSIAMRLRVDDGCVVYLDGQPVIIQNMDQDLNNLTYQSLALAPAVEDDLVTGTNLMVGTEIGPLNPGEHVVAVEVHQEAITSSDISLDLEIIGNPGNNVPVVSLVAPTNNQVFVSGDPVNVTAVAMDKDGGVVGVQFFVDGVAAGTDANPPYAGTATAVAGTHVITAVATDNAGLTNASSVTINVTAGPVITFLINSSNVWSYLDDGTDQSSAWHTDPFNDALWKSGQGQFGYGEADQATLLSVTNAAGETNITYYFRRHFTVSDLSSITGLVLRVQRDDGAIVYINGTEVWRDNMPLGAVNYLTPANGAVADDGQPFVPTNISPSVLISGQNLMAVEIHQAPLPSSDISFDLMLESISTPVPAGPRLTITLNNPPPAPFGPAGMLSTSATLSWTPSTPGFRLIQANTVLGPWTTSPSQVNGQTITPLSGVSRFYQLVNP